SFRSSQRHAPFSADRFETHADSVTAARASITSYRRGRVARNFVQAGVITTSPLRGDRNLRPRNAGSKFRVGVNVATAKIASTTLWRLRITSKFQKRKTVYPRERRNSVPSAL